MSCPPSALYNLKENAMIKYAEVEEEEVVLPDTPDEVEEEVSLPDSSDALPEVEEDEEAEEDDDEETTDDEDELDEKGTDYQ